MAKIIFWEPPYEEFPATYLVDLETEFEYGVVVTEDKVRGAPFFILSILVRGLWEEYDGDQSLLDGWELPTKEDADARISEDEKYIRRQARSNSRL